MYKYMRNNLSNDWGILELQDKILEIAVYVDKFCEENNIEYCLMGGSALGAVRHEGFIPWDDDLDMFMTPDNYEKFVKLFNEKGDHEKFVVEPFGEFDNMITIGKVRAKNTTFIEPQLVEYKITHSVYIDIFVLHVCPDNFFKRINQYVWSKYIVAKTQCTKDLTRYGFLLRTVLKVLKISPRLFLVKFALKQVYKYRNEPSKYYCHFLGRATFKNGRYERKLIDSTKRVPFENYELCVPNRVEDYLAERFGDYMQIPSIDEIKRFQHASVWDTEKDYKDYLKKEPAIDRKYLF
ncbi:MAG: LicD family protein [Clostridia bacterium]|nr:LicD family protein [Clostridia bacterium]